MRTQLAVDTDMGARHRHLAPRKKAQLVGHHRHEGGLGHGVFAVEILAVLLLSVREEGCQGEEGARSQGRIAPPLQCEGESERERAHAWERERARTSERARARERGPHSQTGRDDGMDRRRAGEKGGSDRETDRDILEVAERHLFHSKPPQTRIHFLEVHQARVINVEPLCQRSTRVEFSRPLIVIFD